MCVSSVVNYPTYSIGKRLYYKQSNGEMLKTVYCNSMAIDVKLELLLEYWSAFLLANSKVISLATVKSTLID